MNKLQFTKEQVEQALIEQKGMVSYAARTLCCTPQTINNYIRLYPELEDIKRFARMEIVDAAEIALMKGIAEGNAACIVYALSQLGRDRGYGRRLLPADEQPAYIPTTTTEEKRPEIDLGNGMTITI